MVDIGTITAAIAAATAGVGLIDKIGDQISHFLTRQSPPGAHAVKIERDGDAIVQKHHGVEDQRPGQRITGADLQKLPQADLLHIKVLEQSMDNHYAVWADVYPQLALAIDPIVKAKTELQLRGIIVAMKGDLVGILNFLESAGLQLDDHYKGIRNVVASA